MFISICCDHTAVITTSLHFCDCWSITAGIWAHLCTQSSFSSGINCSLHVLLSSQTLILIFSFNIWWYNSSEFTLYLHKYRKTDPNTRNHQFHHVEYIVVSLLLIQRKTLIWIFSVLFATAHPSSSWSSWLSQHWITL